MNNKPVIIDLFSGCGGFGLGAELAGFHTVVAVDNDETLQSAYKINFPNTRTITQDITTIIKEDWQTILNGQEVDGVIGGPPCQGYSRIGLGNKDDPRRELLIDFFRHVNILQPKFFVMENVEGLLDEKNKTQLDKAIKTIDPKYTVLEPMVIDATHCGAPTKRKRIIVIGYDPKKLRTLQVNDFLFNEDFVNVFDAISDLPEPIKQSKGKNDFGFANYKLTNPISNYARNMRSIPPKFLGAEFAVKKLSQKMVSGCFDTIHTKNVQQRYQAVEPGKTDKVSRSKKLSWDGFCPTLRAGTGPSNGSHQAVRPLHPEQGRVITVREAARLQGFPDWFVFHPTKWHSFRMIGNSVSPVVSEKILNVIYNKLKEVI